MFFVVDKTTNACVSIAGALSEIASPLPSTLKVIDVGTFDPATQFWDTVTATLRPIVTAPNAVQPPVTKLQAAALLKALLEAPPTAQSPWSQLQRDQAQYLGLIGQFRDLRSGSVY